MVEEISIKKKCSVKLTLFSKKGRGGILHEKLNFLLLINVIFFSATIL